jgi:hypothetical protein
MPVNHPDCGFLAAGKYVVHQPASHNGTIKLGPLLGMLGKLRNASADSADFIVDLNWGGDHSRPTNIPITNIPIAVKTAPTTIMFMFFSFEN